MSIKSKSFITEPLVSVIIPVYNVEPYISRCLQSVKDNTYQNLEIICIDDGSTDKSGEICDTFALNDSRFIVIHKENEGISAARNDGLRKTTGDYIAFIDSDDWIHKSYFSILMESMLDNHVDMAMCDYLRTSEDFVFSEDDPIYETRILKPIEMLSGHATKSYVWRRIYKKTLIDGIVFDKAVKIEDALFNIQIVADNPDFKIVYISVQLYAYLYRQQSLITYLSGDDYLVLGEKIYSIAKEAKKDYLQSVFAVESMKRLLSARFEFDLVKDIAKCRECRLLMSKVVKMIGAGKVRLEFNILKTVPSLYHIYRIFDDPTMKTYVKNRKNTNQNL